MLKKKRNSGNVRNNLSELELYYIRFEFENRNDIIIASLF